MQAGPRHDQDKSRFLLSSAAATFAIGVTFALFRVSRKRPSLPFFRSNADYDPSFSPVLHAAKALVRPFVMSIMSRSLVIFV